MFETLFKYTLCGCLLVICLTATAMVLFYVFTVLVDPYKKADRMYQAAKAQLNETAEEHCNLFIVKTWVDSGTISDTDFRNRCKALLRKKEQ